MTKDVIALTERMPDPAAILAGLFAGGPDLGVQSTAGGAVIQLCTSEGHPLLSVDAPVLLQVPGEAARLLGLDAPVFDGPMWWTETRASAAAPEAEKLVGSFAGRLTTILGGSTWPTEAATTDVIALAPDTAALTAPDASLPQADVVTDRAAVLLLDRPVIALTAWLSDVLRTTATGNRALQIVTPPHTRLTLPTHTALGAPPNRWVVQNPEGGYYDGRTGAELHWYEGHFTPTGDGGGPTLAKPFAEATTTDAWQLLLTLQTRHAPTKDLLLGGALEAAWQALTGAPPAGWSTAEPVNIPWSRRQVTDLARTRAPEPTWLTAIGHPDHPAQATLRVLRTPAGVEEHITLALGYGPDETVPLDTITDLATTLTTQHSLTSMLTSRRTARRDLTVPPHMEPTPSPVTFTLGPDAVEGVGRDHASHPPLDLTPSALGHSKKPAFHYALGNGTDPAAWNTLQSLTRHLRAGQAHH